MNTSEILQLVIPLLVLQIGLLIYCLVDLSKNGVRNFSKLVWILIILCINLIGPISYLVFGRGDSDANHKEFK